MARRDEGGAARGHHGATPKAFASRAKPDGLFPENPPGGGSFVRGRRWLVPYSPLRGCAELAALATAKIPRRSAPRSFQTGSSFPYQRDPTTVRMRFLTHGRQFGEKKVKLGLTADFPFRFPQSIEHKGITSHGLNTDQTQMGRNVDSWNSPYRI